MTLNREDNIENGEGPKYENPVSQAQEPFREKAFCIVGDELKAKMEVLGLDGKGFTEIFSSENEIAEYLEIVDKYFEQLKIIKDYFWQKNTKMLYEPNNKREAKKMTQEIKDETKNNLGDLLTHHKSLKILFSKYPHTSGELIADSLKNGYFSDLMDIAWYGRDGVKYQFNPVLVKEFFHSIKNNESTVNGKNAYELLCDAYNNLWKHFQDINLFNNLIKLGLANGDQYLIVNLYYHLSKYNEQQIECFAEDYELLIQLGMIAGKNNSTFFDSPYIMENTTKLIQKNSKINESIIGGIEKLGPDFIYVFDRKSGFIKNILERFPDRFVEFCENLKKLADYSGSNDTFYNKCLTGITDFIIDYPDKWDYLLKIGEIFEESTPGILSIGKDFVFELIKYFPNDYEEILLEVRDVGEHIHGGNKGYFFTWGLKFLAKFLEEGKEIFLKNLYELKKINDEKLKQNHNRGSILFIDGLTYITYYMFWFPNSWPEIGERIIKIINKYGRSESVKGENFFRQFMGGFNDFLKSQVIDKNPQILNELLNFLEKVGGSNNTIRVISSLKELVNYKQKITSPNKYFTDKKNLLGWQENHNKIIEKLKEGNQNAISYTLAYLLKHKKSKIIPFIQNLNIIKDLNLGVNIHQVLLGGVSLEYKSNEELQEIFAGENIENSKIWKYFIKIGGKNHPKLEEMKVWIASIMPKKGKSFDKSKILPTLVKIQNVFAESMLEYFEKIIHKKIHLKLRREFGILKDFDDNLLNENLFEFYKMYSSTQVNKSQAFELIQRYLRGEVYIGNGDIFKMYPYNRTENKAFLQKTLKDKPGIWLSRNERVFEIDENNDGEEKADNIPEQIVHHLKVANEKLKLLEVKDKKGDFIQFTTHGKLIDYFDTKLKKDKKKYDKNLFADLELQINAIKNLLKIKSSKKVSKIKIYHELEPLKIAMMGNWVDNSCLSYYSSVGNYWSAITNALEVNKGVFYIEDEYGNVIARVLVGIDNNGKLEIHPMYFKGNIGLDLKKYFNNYIEDLAKQLGIQLDGNRNHVKILFCDNWYDGD